MLRLNKKIPTNFFATLNDQKIDDILVEREKNKLLQEEMEATLHDIQNM